MAYLTHCHYTRTHAIQVEKKDSSQFNLFYHSIATWYVFDCAEYTVGESSGTVTVTIVRKGDLRSPGHVCTLNICYYLSYNYVYI